MTTRSRFQALAGLVAGAALQVLLSPAAVMAAAWPRWASPEEAGFASQPIADAEQRWYNYPNASATAFFLVYKGKVLADFGDETYPFECHSIRKSLLSALYGIQVERGQIDLAATLAELGIDDDPPLNSAERQATVADLLKSRSGVYHEAACEAQEMRDLRPPRGSHPPGTFFYYNNWDFNALGTIFRQETGLDIFRAFKKTIGRRIGMQDFEASDCWYSYESWYSIHPCYKFRMSARDRARFGQLFLQKGRWGRRQIIPEAWIEKSTRAYSENIADSIGVPGMGFGYMWVVHSPEFSQFAFRDRRLHRLSGFSAAGNGGQFIFVFPDAEMVAVIAVDMHAGGAVYLDQTASTLEAILTAGPIVDLKLARVKARQQAVTAGDGLRVVARAVNKSAEASRPTTVEIYLTPEDRPDAQPYLLGGIDLPALAGGKKKIVRATLEIPADLPVGVYFVVGSADDDKSNFDLNRENNLKIAKRSLEVR